MSTTPTSADTLHHHSRHMRGRDRHEAHRVATPLELLFDLTFVVALGLGASQLAHALAEGHYLAAFLGFGLASFGICWAWTNFTWFASAYDTDDWIFRIVTMVQMISVLVFAIGLPRMFASIEHGEHLDTSVMVLGYVIMRVALVFQWLRAARQDPSRRRSCLTYAVAVSLVQIGWVLQIYALYYYLVRRFDPFHLWLLGATAGVVAVAVFAALSAVNMAVCLVILMLAPAVTVVGYEVRGYRHQAASLLSHD